MTSLLPQISIYDKMKPNFVQVSISKQKTSREKSTPVDSMSPSGSKDEDGTENSDYMNSNVSIQELPGVAKPEGSSSEPPPSDPQRRAVSPGKLSVKSDFSMDTPLLFKTQRTVSPDKLSVKSDFSMDTPLLFKNKPRPSHRRSTPVDSMSPSGSKDEDGTENCDYMNSNVSIQELPGVAEPEGSSSEPPPSDPQRRAVSPGKLSVKSDFSMDTPLLFKTQRTVSPDKLSVKSDFSMDTPLLFKNEPRPSHRQDSLPKLVPEMVNLWQPFNSDHKCCLRRGCERVTEGSDEPGTTTTFLNRIYTELYITEGQSEDINTEHEVRQLEMASKKVKDTKISCPDIFKALADEHKRIRVVLTNGIAGIGKTFLVLKFTLDWAQDLENQDIGLVIPLSFRVLNLVKDEQYSLLKLIRVFHSGLQAVTAEVITACKLMFILDGLDESRFSLDFHNCQVLSDVTQETSVNVLLTNLIRGTLLPTALIWITSRPAAANQIPRSCVDRVTEVRGFTDAQKEEYFRKRYGMYGITTRAYNRPSFPTSVDGYTSSEDEYFGTWPRHRRSMWGEEPMERSGYRILLHIKSSRSLSIMCHIPVFCWISGTVLEHMLQRHPYIDLPKTLTDLYSHFLLVQTKKKKEKYREVFEKDELTEEDYNVLLGLGKLAFEELEKGNLMFYQEDLEQCGLDVSDALVFSGVCTEIFKQERVIFNGTVYSFVHLSIQEFLAAAYIHRCFTDRNIKILKEFLGDWYSYSTLDDFVRKVMEKSFQSQNGHLDLFVRFLHGFCLKSNCTLLSGLLGPTEITHETRENIIGNLKEMITSDVSLDRSINIFHCLQEMNEQTLHQEIQEFLSSNNESKTNLSEVHCSALAYMLQMSEKVMDEFDLQTYITSTEGRRRLIPAIRNCKTAVLANCELSEGHLEVVASALKCNHSHLKKLDLSSNALWDSQMDLLCDGLRSPTCRLESLKLNWCLLSESTISSLTTALNSNPLHLRELDLSNNTLLDDEIKKLCEFLQNPDCKLRILRLGHCKLSKNSCRSLVSTLRSSSSQIEELDLSGSNVWNSAACDLIDLMESPRYKLKTLRLD